MDEAQPSRKRRVEYEYGDPQAPEVSSRASTNKGRQERSPVYENRSPYFPEISPLNKYRHHKGIIEQIEPNFVSRRTEYDPETIARDILVSAGLHPTLQPLNEHLKVLQTQFDAVDDYSDLCTFRWDLVDPDEPVKEHRRIDIIDLTSDGESVAYEEISGQLSPIFSDSHSHSVRKPAKLSAQPPSTNLKGLHELPRTSLSNQTLPRNTSENTIPAGSVQTIEASSLIPVPTGVDKEVLPGKMVPINPESKSSPFGDSYRYHSPYSSKAGLFSQLKRLPDTTAHSLNSAPQSNINEPRPQFQIIIKSPSPLRQSQHSRIFSIDNDDDRRAGAPGKKRGRPSKNGNSSTSRASNPKKRGRPAKDPNSAVVPAKKPGRKRLNRAHDVPVAPPIFYPFVCEWKDCEAELQNLETLRMHIYNVHRKVDRILGDWLCRWGVCLGRPFQKVYNEDGTCYEISRAEPTYLFDSEVAWIEHMETKHLLPQALCAGDGPHATSFEPPSNTKPAYLFDANGEQVTPSIENQKIEGGKAKINNAKRFLKKRVGYQDVWEPRDSPEAYEPVQKRR